MCVPSSACDRKKDRYSIQRTLVPFLSRVQSRADSKTSLTLVGWKSPCCTEGRVSSTSRLHGKEGERHKRKGSIKRRWRRQRRKVEVKEPKWKGERIGGRRRKTSAWELKEREEKEKKGCREEQD